MGLWLYFCQGQSWLFSALVINGTQVLAGSYFVGIFRADSARVLMGPLWNLFHCGHIAIWADIFWIGIDGGNAGSASGPK